MSILWFLLFINKCKNQTFNDAYIYGRGLEDIYLNRRKQKTFIIWFLLFKNKCKNMKRMNKK